jgi:peptidoglycan hydrolase-like protein with peptidoglycan-binding domain
MLSRDTLAGIALLALIHPATAAAPDGRPTLHNTGATVHHGGALAVGGEGWSGASWQVAQASYQIEDLQRALNQLGYSAGPPDGVMGPATRGAIRTYQADHGLPLTGEFSLSLLDHVRSTLAAVESPEPAPAAVPEEQLITSIQAELRRRGYDVPVVSGRLDAPTEAAIRAYERDRGLPVTGEPSERLLADLTGVTPEAPVDRELVREIQRELQRRGYDIAVADGVIGPTTRNAIRTYQADAGLPITGEPSPRLLQALRTDEAVAPEVAEDFDLPEQLEDIDWRVVLHDTFADRAHTRDLGWTVHAGEFTVEDEALVSRVTAVPEPDPEVAREEARPEDIGRALLRGILEQALGGEPTAGVPAAAEEYDPAEISTAVPIDNAFRIRLDLSARTDEGQIAFGPYQGDDRSAGYRVAYVSGDRPSLELLSVSPRGVRVIDTADQAIDVDTDVHTIAWYRFPDGRMTVAVNGQEVISATDQGFQQPFHGFALTNIGGEYAIDRVTVWVPELR